jgi:hypothetical protein
LVRLGGGAEEVRNTVSSGQTRFRHSNALLTKCGLVQEDASTAALHQRGRDPDEDPLVDDRSLELGTMKLMAWDALRCLTGFAL